MKEKKESREVGTENTPKEVKGENTPKEVKGENTPKVLFWRVDPQDVKILETVIASIANDFNREAVGNVINKILVPIYQK